MKRITDQFTHHATLAAAVVLLAFVVLAIPVPSFSRSSGAGMATTDKVSKTDRVEARIKQLHSTLQITSAQEELWNNVTQVMRENAKTMEDLIKTRTEQGHTMSALDDLKSYSDIATAHSDGLVKFIPVFEPLYDSMSDDQKKNADMLFRHQRPHKGSHQGSRQGHHPGHVKAKSK